jgi:hypothetical protein
MMPFRDRNSCLPNRPAAVNYRLISKLYQRQRGAQRGKSLPEACSLNGPPAEVRSSL